MMTCSKLMLIFHGNNISHSTQSKILASIGYTVCDLSKRILLIMAGYAQNATKSYIPEHLFFILLWTALKNLNAQTKNKCPLVITEMQVRLWVIFQCFGYLQYSSFTHFIGQHNTLSSFQLTLLHIKIFNLCQSGRKGLQICRMLEPEVKVYVLL